MTFFILPVDKMQVPDPNFILLLLGDLIASIPFLEAFRDKAAYADLPESSQLKLLKERQVDSQQLEPDDKLCARVLEESPLSGIEKEQLWQRILLTIAQTEDIADGTE